MKEQVIFRLLTVLQEETDAQHRLSQQALMNRLKERFQITLNRRTLKSYLDDLIAAGFPLNATAIQRTLPDGSQESMLTDWYLEPKFEVSELRVLCDLLAAMPAIPEQQRETLTKKITELAPPSFQNAQPLRSITYLHTPPAQQLLYSIELLCEAIDKKCMVSFQYGNYVLNQNQKPELKPRCQTDGEIRNYLVSPYEIVVSHGRYYLICCKEPYRTISNYRIDRMLEMKLMSDFDCLPLTDTKGFSGLPQQFAEQLYMYSGEPEEIRFLADASILSDILDWFGCDISVTPGEQVNTLYVTVKTNPTAMLHWALQYGKYVTVLSPDSLRDEIARRAQSIFYKYQT